LPEPTPIVKEEPQVAPVALEPLTNPEPQIIAPEVVTMPNATTIPQPVDATQVNNFTNPNNTNM